MGTVHLVDKPTDQEATGLLPLVELPFPDGIVGNSETIARMSDGASVCRLDRLVSGGGFGKAKRLRRHYATTHTERTGVERQ